MTECPELGALERSPRPPELREHAAHCRACALVIAVVDGADRLDDDACDRFDALLAARADGTLGRAGAHLLERHLAGCAACREVAATLSPTQDAAGDHAALPRVDPDAYALGLEIARGGMGRIVAARDLRVGRAIAIKELLGRSPQLAARFEREARVTARLQHPGIVPIYEIGQWPDGTPFYSMRMVDGRTLADAIAGARTLAARLALLPAVIAATAAVAFAHSRRVIHRDLTPSNVLVGAYGETVVIDWGLAKDLAAGDARDDAVGDAPADASSERLTSAGAVIGTAAYMPPEQAHALPVDERADVYALGAILYHLLAGAPPYRAKTTKELLRAVKTGPPPPIDAVAPGTPRDLVSIVSKAMAREPDARYPSARELAEELERFQTGRLVEAHAYSRLELARRFVRRHRAAVTVSALALAVLASAGTVAVVNILGSRAAARATVRELTLEKGRVELLAGQTQRALAYLHAAYVAGDDSPSLRFLLGSALAGFAASERTLDCGGSVRNLELSRDGVYLAAGCLEVAKVWRLADGHEVAAFRAETVDPTTGARRPSRDFERVMFSADGAQLATWGEDGTARVWDIARARAIELAHGAHVTRAGFTPDGARLFTTGTDGRAHIWDLAHPARPVRTMEATTSPFLRHVYGALTPDGAHLLTVTFAGSGMGFDVATGQPFGAREHGSNVLGGELSPDGTLAMTCGTDRGTKVWNARTGALVHALRGHTDVVWKCVFSADGKLALTAGHDGRAHVWDLADGSLVTTVEHGDVVIDAHFAPPAGDRFATTGVGGRVKVWHTHSGALLASLDALRGKGARFSRDGARLVVERGDGRVQIWRQLEGNQQTFAGTAGAERVLSSDGTRLVTARGPASAREVAIWDTTVTPARRLEGPPRFGPFAVAARGMVLATARAAAVELVDLRTGAARGELALPAPATRLALAADGARLVVEYAAAPPEIWDVATRTRRVTLAGAQHAVLADDGRRALAWRTAALAIAPPTVWDVDAGVAGPTLRTTGATWRPLGFAAGGARIALVEDAGRADGAVSLWDARTGAAIARRPDTTGAPALDPTATWLTTIDRDRIVTVWRARDGGVHATFHADQLLHAQTNADGTLVVGIAEHGGAVMVMSARDGRVLARRPIAHAAPAVTQAGFDAPAGAARWSAEGAAVIIDLAARDLSRWHVVHHYARAQIAELVKRNVPWRVDDGRLVWIRNGRLHGTVREGGVPRAGRKLRVEIRTLPDVGGAVTWESAKIRVSTREVTTDAAGAFALDGLLPGEYTLTIDGRAFTAYVSADDEPVVIEL